MAHEINNPLAYVLFNLESLVEYLPRLQVSCEPAMVEDLLDRAEQALAGTRRIRDIARGLGAFSRVETDDVSDVQYLAEVGGVTVDKPFQVESVGELKPVDLSPTVDRITPFQAEVFALNLINADRRLTKALLKEGSCDTSYQLAGKARFRVNVFSQKGYYSTVMRQLGVTGVLGMLAYLVGGVTGVLLAGGAFLANRRIARRLRDGSARLMLGLALGALATVAFLALSFRLRAILDAAG